MSVVATANQYLSIYICIYIYIYISEYIYIYQNIYIYISEYRVVNVVAIGRMLFSRSRRGECSTGIKKYISLS